MPEQSNYEQLIAALGRADDEVERALQLLYGELPDWFPKPSLEHATRIIHRLTQDDFSAEQIAEFVTAEMCGNEIFYLYAHPTVARQDINELAHIKYALTLPDNECLEMLAGTLAATGIKFRKGRKVNSVGPVRKAIARELKKNQALKPRHLWALLANKPPKGWDFEGEGREARIWITGRKPIGYARFSEVCKQESDKLAP